MISDNELTVLREEYKPGTRVEIINMEDRYVNLQPGETGTVISVDNIGTIHVEWDRGITLGIAYGEDSCKIIWNP